MLYNDRGMKKWQGFILSEHHTTIRDNQALNRPIAPKEQLSEAKISSVLQGAFNQHKTIKIQLNALNHDLYLEDIVGTIKGFENGKLYIESNLNLIEVEIDLIRHVESVVNKKWFQ